MVRTYYYLMNNITKKNIPKYKASYSTVTSEKRLKKTNVNYINSLKIQFITVYQRKEYLYRLETDFNHTSLVNCVILIIVK